MSIDDDCSTLRITVFPHVLQSLPTVIRWLSHALWLRPLLTKYLDSVVRGFEWYIIHGEAVPKNAFGKHPWFHPGHPRKPDQLVRSAPGRVGSLEVLKIVLIR